MKSTTLNRILPDLTAAAIIAAFAVVNARGLGAVPMVNEDEPWIAAPGVEFFRTGRFATRLFAGYFGSERHYYDFMPLHSLLDGAVTRMFGMGLVQVRALSLALAVATLILTYVLGRKLLSRWHSSVAVLILALWPIAGTGIVPYLSLTTGIPLADLGRIGRYDILVPVCGLASLLVLLPALADADRHRVRLIIAGALAGLAALAHYYGVVWLVVIGAALLSTKGRHGAALSVWPAFGFALSITPWLVFVARDLPMFLAQKNAQALRYGPAAGSLFGEFHRYDPIVRGMLAGHVASLLWIAASGAGLMLLARAGFLRGDRGSRILATATVIVIAFLAVMIRRRLFNYLGMAWPLFALLAATALIRAWRTRVLIVRIVVLGMVTAASAEGAMAYSQLRRRAGSTTPYAAICDRIARNIPPSARLLALQHWWIGVGGRVADYRSFIVPITRMNPLESAHPISFTAAMALDPADFILIDPAMADVLRAAGDPARPKASPYGTQIRDFLAANAVEVDAFDDATYGRFVLYRVLRPDQ